jgi:nitrite reductase/ring-hydroxylating ferredoxin subunit
MSDASGGVNPSPLCHIDELDDPGARGLEGAGETGSLDLIVVRRGNHVTAYVNSCPHRGTPLETFPGRFLTRDRTELLCTTHGARFRLDDGLCVAGPCEGEALRKVATVQIDGFVYLAQICTNRRNTKV